MKEVLYAVIILNYNTIDDAIAAYESVKKKCNDKPVCGLYCRQRIDQRV